MQRDSVQALVDLGLALPPNEDWDPLAVEEVCVHAFTHVWEEIQRTFSEEEVGELMECPLRLERALGCYAQSKARGLCNFSDDAVQEVMERLYK